MGALTNPGFSVKTEWALSKTNTGTKATTQSDKLSSTTTFDTAVTNTALVLPSFSVAAGANTDVNLRAFTDLAGNATNTSRAYTLFVRAVATNTSQTGGQVKVSPGSSNPFRWFFGTNTDSVTLPIGTTEAVLGVSVGAAGTITNTTYNINIANPGNTAITVSLAAHLGA